MTDLGTGMKVWEPSPSIFGPHADPTPTPFFSPVDAFEESLLGVEHVTSFKALPLMEPEDETLSTHNAFRLIVPRTARTQMDALMTLQQLWPDRVTFRPAAFHIQNPERSLPDQGHVVGLIDEICKNLRLGVRVAASLVGVSVRRYHELRGTAKLPLPKLLAAAEVAEVLDKFYKTEPELLVALFRTDEDEALELLAAGDYTAFSARIEDVRAERARQFEAVPDAVELPTRGEDLEQVRSVLHNPLFERVLSLLRSKSLNSGMESQVWRLTGEVDMAAAFEAMETGDPMDEVFGFLVTLARKEREAFHSRANELLADPARTLADWEGFLKSESDAAMANYHPFFAQPVPSFAEDEAGDPSEEEDIYYLRRLGIDPASGRLLSGERE